VRIGFGAPVPVGRGSTQYGVGKRLLAVTGAAGTELRTNCS
jgi:hypothetical protein